MLFNPHAYILSFFCRSEPSAPSKEETERGRKRGIKLKPHLTGIQSEKNIQMDCTPHKENINVD